LNQLKTDLFTAKSVGQKGDPKGISADNTKTKSRPKGGFLIEHWFNPICFRFFSLSPPSFIGPYFSPSKRLSKNDEDIIINWTLEKVN